MWYDKIYVISNCQKWSLLDRAIKSFDQISMLISNGDTKFGLLWRHSLSPQIDIDCFYHSIPLCFISSKSKSSALETKKKWNRLTGRRGRDLAQRFNHKYTENLFLPIFYVVIFFSSKNALISWLRSKVTKNVQFNCTTMELYFCTQGSCCCHQFAVERFDRIGDFLYTLYGAHFRNIHTFH